MYMDILEYNGKMYKRQGQKWSDMDGCIVYDILQVELNAKYIETIDLPSLTLQEIIEHGDKFKNSSSYGYALRFYEHAAKEANENDLAYILPRMTSCYRLQGQPKKAIDILSFAKSKYGAKMITPVLLTSAAAAYCDLEDYENAKKCCNRAYAALGGKSSGELASVYARIKKNRKEF